MPSPNTARPCSPLCSTASAPHLAIGGRAILPAAGFQPALAALQGDATQINPDTGTPNPQPNEELAPSAHFQQPRNQRSCGAPISIVRRTEGLPQVGLLQSDLAPVCETRHRQASSGVQLAGYNRRAGKHPQHRGIDRMAHEAVWTGPDQAVIDLDGDLSAPIATEMPPRPYAQHSGRCLDVKTGTSRVWPAWRSEEHTSELQSLRHLVCRLLLDK